jgi:hypothetical protein
MKLRLAAAAMVLAGCTVLRQAQDYVPEQATLAPPLVHSLANYRALPTVSDDTPSWIAPDAGASTKLLYVSDWATNDVFIYNYATHAAAGKLTGFHAPYGQCVDASGSVWIAEAGGFDVVKYAHAGNKPVKRLQTSGYPIGCAVNAANGDLAVANFTGKSGAGNVQVWKDAAGHPTTYKSDTLFYFWPPAYDNKGNLFVEGQAQKGPYSVEELPKGAGALRAVSMPGATIHYAGATVWDGKYIGFTDQNSDNKNTTVIFRASVNSFKAKIVGRIHLTDHCSHNYTDVMQPFVVPVAGGSPNTVVGGNLRCTNRFDYWPYPGGGDPKITLKGAPQEPFGQSVSKGS